MIKRYVYLFTIVPKIFYKIWSQFRFNVFVLSCIEETTPKNRREVLYITPYKITPYFVARIYKKPPVISIIKHLYIWQIPKFISQAFPNFNILLLEFHKFLTRFIRINDALLIPVFIRQILDLNKPKDVIVGKFRRNTKSTDLRKIRKFNYTYEVLTDLDSLTFFYERMHVPYIRSRFGDMAFINSFNEHKKMFKSGELIFVKYNNKIISGVLCENRNKKYFWRRVGVLDGDISYIKKGALSATSYFAILRAKELKAEILDFGLSRPFLSDGVLRHKRKWGAGIYTTTNRLMYLKSNDGNFFDNQPFICIEGNKLKSVIFTDADISKEQSNINEIIEKYGSPGITCFKIISPYNETEIPNLS